MIARMDGPGVELVAVWGLQVTEMAVSDGFRRRGVASGLLKAVDEHAKVGFMTHPIQPAHSSFVGPCVMNECQWLKPWIWLHLGGS